MSTDPESARWKWTGVRHALGGVITLAASLNGLLPFEVQAAAGELKKFDSVYEPSGIQQLPDGRLLIIEDETMQAASIATVNSEGELMTERLVPDNMLLSIMRQPALGALDDLEGIDIDNAGYVYAITSHSQPDRGRASIQREKMVRFQLDGKHVRDPVTSHSLKQSIAGKHGKLMKSISGKVASGENGFNIEGLSFDENKKRLLIGLRAPLIDDQAVVAVLLNPQAVFELEQEADIADQLVFLDLDKSGIRAMTYDKSLGGYLIVACRESGKKKHPFELWFWTGESHHAPRRIKVPSADDIQHAEGISPVRMGDADGILIVIDDGNTKARKGGHYLFLRYDQLQMDDH